MKAFLNRKHRKVPFFFGMIFFILSIAIAAMADGVWEFENSINVMSPYQDGVILTEGNCLWFWSPDMQEPQRIRRSNEHSSDTYWISALFTDDGGQLMALCEGIGNTKVFRCSIEDRFLSMKEICTLSLPDAENCFVNNAFCQQNMVFAVLANRNTGEYTLYAYDMNSNQEWIWPNYPAQDITSYKDGLLLGTRMEFESGMGIVSQLLSLDVTTQKATLLSSLPISARALTYSMQTDQIIYLLSPVVCAGPISGKQKEQGYLPVTSSTMSMGMMIGNDVYALADNNRLLWTRLDPGFSINKCGYLTIAEIGVESNITRNFRKDNPGIPVMSRNVALFPADIAQAIRGNDTETDVFVVRTNFPGYKNLLSKGYFTDLHFDEDLTALVSGMPAEISKGLTYEGKLAAFPVELYFSENMALSYSPEVLEYMGVAEEDLPGNLSSLLSALIDWYESGKMDDVRLFDTERPDYRLTSFVLGHYTGYCEAAQDEPLNYTGGLFSELMEKADRVIQLMKKQRQASGQLPALFMPDGPDLQYKMFEPNTTRVLLPLTPKEGMPMRFTACMTVCIVNPLTTKLPQAVQYLRTAVKNMDYMNKLYLWPDITVPMEQPGYAKDRRETEEMMTQTEKDIKKAPAENRKVLSIALEGYKSDLSFIEQSRWILTQETIDDYRQYAPDVYLLNDFVGTMLDYPESVDILNRYLTGNMGWREMAQALQDRYLMIQAE
jgi:hypothetical protein